MAAPLIPLTRFSGDKLDYSDWRRDTANRSTMASTVALLGLLGFLLSEGEWIATLVRAGHANPGPFIPRVHPGERPNAAAPFPAWKADEDAYLKQQQDINTFKQLIRASLDQGSLDLLDSDTDQATSLSLREMLERLDAFYRVLSPADLHRNRARLLVPYTPDKNIRSFISTHRRVHLVARENNFEIQEDEKVKALIDALKPCGLFNSRIEIWTMLFPLAINQRFDNLSNTIIEYSDNHDAQVTSGSSLYSNQVMTPVAAAPSVGLSQDMLMTISQCVAAAVQAAIAPSHSAVTPPVVTQAKSKNNQYCWSHGFCNHISRKCNFPHEGHQVAATANNRLGGSSKNARNK